MKLPGFLRRVETTKAPDVLVSVTKWRHVFTSAQQLFEQGMYDDALGSLEGILKGMEGSFGPVIDDLRPKVNGLIGILHFRKGNIRQARLSTEEALRECRRTGDQDGVRIYTEHLRLISLSEGPRGQNSAVMQVRRQIVDAQKLSDEGSYATSNRALMGMLDSAEQDALSEYRSKIFGLLGLNWYRLYDKEKAQHYTEMAVAACERTSDVEGLRIYSSNLNLIRNRNRPQ